MMVEDPAKGDLDLMDSFWDSVSDAALHLILLPTEQCNFRCSYCYEDFDVGRMSPETVEGIKSLLKRRMPTLKRLAVSWFGGEPLLAKDIVEGISEYICASIGDEDRLEYMADMTTNCYHLDEDTTARLCSLGVRHFQISLDGPKHHHDRTRTMRGGQATFDRIWSRLLALRDSKLEFTITLRIHLTQTNLSSMEGFLVEVRETFLGDPRFAVFLKPVARLGGANDQALDVISCGEHSPTLGRLQAIVDGTQSKPHDEDTTICYAAKGNSFVIRANGQVGKCTVILNDDRNALGKLCEDGTMKLNNERLRPWLRGWRSLDVDVLGCPLKGLNGGANRPR